jgi:exodeoxyribonuclease III
MKLISWNVNGLRSVSQKGFLDFVRKEKPDILCLQETKAQERQINHEDIVPEEYIAAFSSASKAGYSGVATYIHSQHKSEISKPLTGIGIRKFDEEGRFLIHRHKHFLLYNVYIPSGTTGDTRQDFKYKFLDVFRRHLTALPKADFSKLIICGDFNICHRDIDIHHPEEATKRGLSGFLPKERKWLDEFIKLGFVDSFRLINGDVKGVYSWWSFRAGARKKNLGWRIDYFLVAKALAKKVRGAAIESTVTGSDH